MNILILACICKHDFQDKEYGKGLRVHNYAIKGNKAPGYRCTVCNSIKSVPQGDKK